MATTAEQKRLQTGVGLLIGFVVKDDSPNLFSANGKVNVFTFN